MTDQNAYRIYTPAPHQFNPAGYGLDFDDFYKTPWGLPRTILDCHLTPEEFQQVFGDDARITSATCCVGYTEQEFTIYIFAEDVLAWGSARPTHQSVLIDHLLELSGQPVLDGSPEMGRRASDISPAALQFLLEEAALCHDPLDMYMPGVLVRMEYGGLTLEDLLRPE